MHSLSHTHEFSMGVSHRDVMTSFKPDTKLQTKSNSFIFAHSFLNCVKGASPRKMFPLCLLTADCCSLLHSIQWKISQVKEENTRYELKFTKIK